MTTIARHLLVLALLGAGCNAHPGVTPWDPPIDIASAPPDPDFPFNRSPAPGPVLEPVYCGGRDYRLEQGGAQLLLVLDRSTSMGGKWNDFTGALLDTVKETEAAVQWGLLTFPGLDLPACKVAEQLDVMVASQNHAALSDAFVRLRPGKTSGSPARMGLLRGIEHLKALPTKTPRYLVLASDGAPNCRDDVQTAALDLEPSLMTVRAAAAEGFHTFVVGIAADKEAEGVLSDLAVAGLEPQPGLTKYFQASSRKDLTTVLRTIARRIQGCVLPLEAVPPAPGLVEVKVEGATVARDLERKEGWDYEVGMTSIRLFGPVCERLMQPELAIEVRVRFGCPDRVIL